jgi:hypothetical protein
MRHAIRLTRSLLSVPYVVVGDHFCRVTLNRCIYGLHKEIGTNRHFQFVKGVFDYALGIEDVYFFQDFPQIHRNIGLGRNDKLDPSHSLKAGQYETRGSNFFNSVVSSRCK